jgi:hypothetical protein
MAGLRKGWKTPTRCRYKLQRSAEMTEILILLAVVGVWYFLQAHLLPKLGIST